VDPVPDPLLLRESGSAGNRTQTSGSVARKSDQLAPEAVDVAALAISIPALGVIDSSNSHCNEDICMYLR
jgi:hypothetical protein